MEENKKIYLAILNITSMDGWSIGAEHFYGELILSPYPDCTIDNIHTQGCYGDIIEIRRPLTLQLARILDDKDGGNTYKNAYEDLLEHPELADDDMFNTNRFDSIDQVVDAGIKKWLSLNIECPFISLYNRRKYDNKAGKTVIITSRQEAERNVVE